MEMNPLDFAINDFASPRRIMILPAMILSMGVSSFQPVAYVVVAAIHESSPPRRRLQRKRQSVSGKTPAEMAEVASVPLAKTC
jgi:hypothetical protein